MVWISTIIESERRFLARFRPDIYRNGAENFIVISSLKNIFSPTKYPVLGIFYCRNKSSFEN
jgi:hypothetical protein